MRGDNTKRAWKEVKKAGTPAPTMAFIHQILEESEPTTMIPHEELVRRISSYFAGITETTIDENGVERSVWITAPSKKAFALSIGIPWVKLNDYIIGEYHKGRPYTDHPHSTRLISNEDIPLLRKAYEIIESFYEEKLSSGVNPGGLIFWLLNTQTPAGWTNDHTVQVVQTEAKPEITLADVPQLEVDDSDLYGKNINMADLPKFD